MNTRATRLILVALLAVVFLSGCGGGPAADETSAAPAAPKVTKEEIIQKFLSGRELDPIEGIWIWDSADYEAAVFKADLAKQPGSDYVAVLTASHRSNWLIGDVKVTIRKTALPNLFSVFYYRGDRSGVGTIATLSNDSVLEMDVPEVGKTVLVKLYPPRGQQVEKKATRLGTGFFVAPNLVATNYHLVARAKLLTVSQGGARWNAKILVADQVNDLSLLRVELPAGEPGQNQGSPQIRPLALGDSRRVKVGDKVVAVALSQSPAGRQVNASEGSVSATTGPEGDPRLLLVGLSGQPASSGGPLLNSRGEVVGTISLTSDNPYLKVPGGALPQGACAVVKTSYLANLLPQDAPESPASPEAGDLGPEQMVELIRGSVVAVEATE